MNSANKIDAGEVLSYLNQLGYTNISAQILKNFLTDLKRLIKSSSHEQNYTINSAFNDYLSVRSTSRTQVDSDSNTSKNNSRQSCERLENNYLVDQKLRQISLHLLKNVNKRSHEHCIHLSEPTVETSHSKDKENRLESDVLITESTSKTTIPSSNPSSKAKSSRQLSSKGKYELCQRILVNTEFPDKTVKVVNRRDPVALYHYYQSEWKKVKFPGEEEHATLRRMIRQKLQDDVIVKKY